MILRSQVFSAVRNSLRASCCVSVLAPAAFRRSMMSLDSAIDDARDAEAEVLLEVVVFGRHDGLAQARRDVVVADDDAPLGARTRR